MQISFHLQPNKSITLYTATVLLFIFPLWDVTRRPLFSNLFTSFAWTVEIQFLQIPIFFIIFFFFFTVTKYLELFSWANTPLIFDYNFCCPPFIGQNQSPYEVALGQIFILGHFWSRCRNSLCRYLCIWYMSENTSLSLAKRSQIYH